MPQRQTLYFHTGTAVRIEVHAREDLAGLSVELLFNPPQEPFAIAPATADEAADLIEPRILQHLEEHGARLIRIVLRQDEGPLTYLHLGRYAVPLIPEPAPST